MNAIDIRALIQRSLAPIAPEVDLDEVESDEPFREEAEIDSMDFQKLLVAVSGELGVEIPDADVGDLVSLDDIVAYLERRT